MTERIHFVRGFLHGKQIMLKQPAAIICVPHVDGVDRSHVQRLNHRGELYMQPCCGLGHKPRKKHSTYRRVKATGTYVLVGIQ